MGRDGDSLNRLRHVAEMLDDEALASLANRGLVRRARKDLERSPPEIVADDGEGLLFRVDEHQIRLDARPAASSCSCPSESTCRHILAAWMHLASMPVANGNSEKVATDSAAASAPVEPDSLPEVLAVDDESLMRCAGSAVFRRALREVSKGLHIEVEPGPPLQLRIDEWNQTVRWLAGAGPSGSLCSCHAVEGCIHRVAAVLGAQLQAGTRELTIDDPVLRASDGAPRTRAELLAEVGDVLAETAALGLTRLSQATANRAHTLATSAHGVDLPRLERSLQALAREISLLLDRHGQASTEALVLQAARTEALRRALEHPKPGLVGRHRGRYERVGELQLIGMGARSFSTRSGYRGLTCYFWDCQTGAWNTWTEARPETGGPFDPIARYGQAGPWQGCGSPRQAATSTLRLASAWRSTTGRLSGRESIRMFRTGPSQPDLVPVLSDWRDVAERVRELFAGGLSDRNELGGVVHLRPTSWLAGEIDSVNQCWRGAILDSDGRQLLVVLRNDEQRSAALMDLAGRNLDASTGLVGLIRLHRGVIEIEPVSLIDAGGVHSLGLGKRNHGGAPAASSDLATRSGDAIDFEDDDAQEVFSGLPGHTLDILVDQLVLTAERGVSARSSKGLGDIATSLGRTGFVAIAQRVARLDDSLARTHHGTCGTTDAARDLLEVAYVADAARVLVSIEHACAAWSRDTTNDRGR